MAEQEPQTIALSEKCGLISAPMLLVHSYPQELQANLYLAAIASFPYRSSSPEPISHWYSEGAFVALD